MKWEDMINELKNIKEKMRDFGYIINRLIKELNHRKRLDDFKCKESTQDEVVGIVDNLNDERVATLTKCKESTESETDIMDKDNSDLNPIKQEMADEINKDYDKETTQ